MNETMYGRNRSIEEMFVRMHVEPERHTFFHPLVPRSSLFAFAVLALVGALTISGSTSASYSDGETSPANAFSASALDFSVAFSSEMFLSPGGQESTVLTVIPAVGTIPFLYSVQGAAGSTALCAVLSATGSAPLSFSGPLASLATSDAASLAPWALSISLPADASGIVDGDVCDLDIAYRAWQIGGAAGSEFHAEKHAHILIHAHISAPEVVVSPPPADAVSLPEAELPPE